MINIDCEKGQIIYLTIFKYYVNI